jgi:hypothetical protein
MLLSPGLCALIRAAIRGPPAPERVNGGLAATEQARFAPKFS